MVNDPPRHLPAPRRARVSDRSSLGPENPGESRSDSGQGPYPPAPIQRGDDGAGAVGIPSASPRNPRDFLGGPLGGFRNDRESAGREPPCRRRDRILIEQESQIGDRVRDYTPGGFGEETFRCRRACCAPLAMVTTSKVSPPNSAAGRRRDTASRGRHRRDHVAQKFRDDMLAAPVPASVNSFALGRWRRAPGDTGLRLGVEHQLAHRPSRKRLEGGVGEAGVCTDQQVLISNSRLQKSHVTLQGPFKMTRSIEHHVGRALSPDGPDAIIGSDQPPASASTRASPARISRAHGPMRRCSLQQAS